MLLNKIAACAVNSSRVLRQGHIKSSILLVIDLDLAVRSCSDEKT